MKSATLLLVALACPLQAALLATLHTTEGDVVVELQHDKTPQAVANFITLADGTRATIDPETGAVVRQRFYDGQKFYRVVNTDTFKIAQTGSGTGNNSGGPGFSFKDEFDPSLRHTGYVLSMANSGPNSNGSQFFVTGGVDITHLDDVHTVFGIITDPASQAAIDAIHAAGDDGSSITSVSLQRTDPVAEAFDEHDQDLPTAYQPAGTLEVSAGTSTTWRLSPSQQEGTILRAFQSPALETGSWQELTDARQHLGLDDPPLSSALLDDASATKSFYQINTASHPGAVAPSSLASRTVSLPLTGGTLRFAFDATGLAGTTTYQPDSGDSIGGPFTTEDRSFDAHSLFFISNTPEINPQYLLVKIGCDSATATDINGRHVTQAYNFGWQAFADGPASITR